MMLIVFSSIINLSNFTALFKYTEPSVLIMSLSMHRVFMHMNFVLLYLSCTFMHSIVTPFPQVKCIGVMHSIHRCPCITCIQYLLHLWGFQNQFMLPNYAAWSPAWMQAHICGGFKINKFCPNMMHEVQPECKLTFVGVSKSIYFARIWCMKSSRNASPHLRRFQNRFILPEYDAWSPAWMQTHICRGFKIDFARVRCIEPSLTASERLGRLGKHLFCLSTMHVARSDCKPTFGGGCQNTFILAENRAWSSAWLQANIWGGCENVYFNWKQCMELGLTASQHLGRL